MTSTVSHKRRAATGPDELCCEPDTGCGLRDWIDREVWMATGVSCRSCTLRRLCALQGHRRMKRSIAQPMGQNTEPLMRLMRLGKNMKMDQTV